MKIMKVNSRPQLITMIITYDYKNIATVFLWLFSTLFCLPLMKSNDRCIGIYTMHLHTLPCNQISSN